MDELYRMCWLYIVAIYPLLYVGEGAAMTSTFVSNEKLLVKSLFEDAGYDPIVRPVMDVNDTLNVTIETTLVKILDLDENRHTMTTNAWIFHEWTDFQLQWNPTDYGGLTTIRVPITRIWVPDIVLFNNAANDYKYIFDKYAVVSHTGEITWVPQARLQSHCPLDLTRFPFDTQSCSLILGSWTHDKSSVNVMLKNSSRPDHMMNSKEWDVNKVSTKVYQWTYQKSEIYVGIITTVTLQRSSSFYQYVFIMPTVIFAFLALLLPFIPPLSRERLLLGMGLILGCTLILMILENHMPTELGTVPVVAAYLAYVMVMVSVNIFFSILAINMCMRDPKHGKIPGWIRWVFLTKLNKLVCISTDPYTALPADLMLEVTTAERELVDMNNGTTELRAPPGGETKSSLEQTMDDVRRYLRLMAAHASIGPQNSHQELVIREWRQVVRVIDRLLFVTFFVLTVVITISMYAHY